MTEELVKDKYEQLINLDKEIVRLELKIKNYFFENVNEKDATGEVEVPLVADVNSEYGRLRTYKNEIKLKLVQVNQKLKKIDYYAKGIRSELLRSGFEKEKVDEETNRIVEIYKKDLEKHIFNLQERLRLINEDPKAYLRFKEYQESNFSSIKSEEAKKNLSIMNEELYEKKKQRKQISDSIEPKLSNNDTSDKKTKFSLKLQFDRKNSKKNFK